VLNQSDPVFFFFVFVSDILCTGSRNDAVHLQASARVAAADGRDSRSTRHPGHRTNPFIFFSHFCTQQHIFNSIFFEIHIINCSLFTIRLIAQFLSRFAPNIHLNNDSAAEPESAMLSLFDPMVFNMASDPDSFFSAEYGAIVCGIHIRMIGSLFSKSTLVLY
jgi:hypothetical protein